MGGILRSNGAARTDARLGGAYGAGWHVRSKLRGQRGLGPNRYTACLSPAVEAAGSHRGDIDGGDQSAACPSPWL
jgi:hypothetical protein